MTTADGVVHTAQIVGRDPTTDLVLLRLDSGRSGRAAGRAHAAGRRHGLGRRRAEPGRHVAVDEQRHGRVDRQPRRARRADRPRAGCSRPAPHRARRSSGGALVDRDGDVTGIVLSPVGDGRMTYAVPIATALSVADELRAVRLRDARRARASTGSTTAAGPTVTGVVAGRPAARAGVHVGDIVESVDKHEVDSMEEVMALVRHDSPGQPIVVEVRRGSRDAGDEGEALRHDLPLSPATGANRGRLSGPEVDRASMGATDRRRVQAASRKPRGSPP